MSKRHVVPIVVGAALLASGCSSAPSAQPPRTPAASSASSTAPRVADPLPASVFNKHPCDGGLTAEQLKQLVSEVPPARHTDNAAGPGCGWTTDTDIIVDVAWMTGVRGGLSQVYSAQEHAAFRQPTEIDGYPALFYNPTEQPTQGCNVAVGIADNLVFDAGLDAIAAKVSRCEGAAQIAEKVLANLKAAAGK